MPRGFRFEDEPKKWIPLASHGLQMVLKYRDIPSLKEPGSIYPLLSLTEFHPCISSRSDSNTKIKTPLQAHGLSSTIIHSTIMLLIHNLVNVIDTTGEFLLRLPDGRVIDTKGWNGWEWTHGIGLYGLYQYHALTADTSTLIIINDWFTKRLAEGTTKNINTMAVFLTLACLYEDR